jgi:hypothetical protein
VAWWFAAGLLLGWCLMLLLRALGRRWGPRLADG